MIDDYAELRQQLSKVNLSDPKSLRKWFDTHSYLTVNDHAIIMGKCTKTVRKLRKRAGILGTRPKTNIKPIPKKSPLVTLPENWRNHDWLKESIARYGSDAVIRATGFTKKAFYSILRKLNVPYSGKFESKNPLCNKAWCHRHYVELNYSLTKCARIAGTNHNTISNWLVKFGIPLKQRGIKNKRSKKKPVPLIFRKLFKQLEDQPIVNRIKVFNKRINVSYADGIERYYDISAIKADQFNCASVPKIFHEYEYDINGEPFYPAHIAISRQQLRHSTIFEKDAALHIYNKMLGERGWIAPRHPDSAIHQEWDYIKSINHKEFINHKGYQAFAKKSVGIIYESYFDLCQMMSILHHHDERWRLISSMRNSILPFNFDYMLRQLCRSSTGLRHRMINPAFYAALFKHLGVKTSILDLNLGSGARAFAACLAGYQYFVNDDSRLKYSMDNGIADLGLKLSLYNYDKVDLVIADGDFSEYNVAQVTDYFKYAKQVMAYVSPENVEVYKSTLHPRAVIPFSSNYRSKDNHYYFIW